jgi:hypothetical protein
MTTKRIMIGVADFTGQRISTLRIGEMVNRHPLPRYTTICERCGTRGTAGQRDIATGKARCLFAGCGKDRLREYLSDTPRKSAEREAARKRKAVSDAEAQLKDTHRQLAAVVRERLLGKVKDPGRIAVDRQLIGIRMSSADASRFNKAEFAKFRAANPDVHWSDELLENLGRYFDVNGLGIISANMLAALFARYRDAGMLPHPPQAKLEPEPAPEPMPEQPSGPKVFVGRDWNTGRECEYTETEVERMSSDEFKRAFKVLPTFTELLSAMEHDRTAR